MKCRVCGETLEPQITELPFNLSAKTIVLLKDLPVLRCEKCGEYATLVRSWKNRFLVGK